MATNKVWVAGDQVLASDLNNNFGNETWTYVGKLTWSNSSGTQNFASLTATDFWRLMINMKNLSSNAFALSMQMNSISSSNYSAVNGNAGSTGTAAPAGTASIGLISNGASAFDQAVGAVIIGGRHNNGVKTAYNAGLSSSGAANNAIFRNGWLISDSNDLTNITIIPAVAMTGTVELWSKALK